MSLYTAWCRSIEELDGQILLAMFRRNILDDINVDAVFSYSSSGLHPCASAKKGIYFRETPVFDHVIVRAELR